jgi:hypothetical protein
MKFTVTQEDIKRGKVLPPTWYVCKIKAVSDKVSKSSNADMTQIDLVVSDNPNNPKCADGDTSTGVPLKPYYITEAGIGFALPFFSAILRRPVKAGDEIESSAMANIVGKELKVFVGNEEFQGRVGNVAKDFMAL